MEKRIVKVMGFDKKYAGGATFWALPYFDTSINNYRTGQEKRVGNPDGLTRQQIEGKRPLSDKQIEMYPDPIVMDPKSYRGEPISRGVSFDLSKDDNGEYINPSSAQRYFFFKNWQPDIIADSESKAIVDKHLFYFVDIIAESISRNENRKKIREAENKVFDALDEASYYELLIYVSYHTGLMYDYSGSPALLEEQLYKICETHSNLVDKFFTKKGSEELFVLKLNHHNIINTKDGAFYSSTDKFLGNTTREVIAYLNSKEGKLVGASWSKALQTRDKRYAEYLVKMEKERKAQEEAERLAKEGSGTGGDNPQNQGQENND